MIGKFALMVARWAARAARPFENAALFSLRLFMTPRGPMLFLAAMALLIGALVALIAFAPGPGGPALTKLMLGFAAFAIFCGYLRAYFASRSETDAALAGLAPEKTEEEIRQTRDEPGMLSLFDLGLFLLGLTVAHTAVMAGLLEGGFGPKAYSAASVAVEPGATGWLIYALWASLGAIDLLGLLPRAGEPVFALRYEFGWAVLWLYAFRLILLGVLFSLAAAAFNARRSAAIALSRPGLWPAKRAHLERLGRGGFLAMADSLSDPDPARREDAARMLGEIGDYPREAAQILITALGDPSDLVRARAAESLGSLGRAAAEASPALTGRLLDAAPAVRSKAAAALGAVAGDRTDLAYPAMAALAQAIPSEPYLIETADPAALASMALSLAQIASAVGDASEQAVEAVDRLRGHRDAQVRQTAAEAYGALMEAAKTKAKTEAQRKEDARAAAREAEWSGDEWPPRRTYYAN